MVVVDAGPDVIDIVGTGGDGAGTFNISTVAAMVLAGAGARVAKHGNRAISGKVGSADVLEALGVRIAMTPEEAAGAVREIGLGFLFAPHLHPAMKNVQGVRRELKMRTVFNLLGPLANPARAQTQVIGAPSAEFAQDHGGGAGGVGNGALVCGARRAGRRIGRGEYHRFYRRLRSLDRTRREERVDAGGFRRAEGLAGCARGRGCG